jgi:hypothetical protein
MNILAQCGFGPKDKIERGLAEGHISGVVFSPRYLTPERMQDQLAQLRGTGGVLMMDPEYFATAYLRNPDPSLGSLEQWGYFAMPRRSGLISGTAVPGVIEATLRVQADLGLEEWIAPNVYVPKADSIDTAIALSFINQAKRVAGDVGDAPVYATLAIDRDAIIHDDDFRNILDALTGLETPPDGYYVLVGGGSARDSGNNVRSDIYHPEVIAGWMYVNHVLSINGARVLNGYCHLLSPLMGICGATACASGWFSTLRCFSMNKYARERAGGQQPVIRYVSTPLLAHIRASEFDDYRSVLPDIATGSGSDAIYSDREPTRTEEALQSWEALDALCADACTGDTAGDVTRFRARIEQAVALWAELEEAGFVQDVEANQERLEAMRAALDLFEEWAELA